MPRMTPSLMASALALLPMTTLAQADVTAADVWNDWRDYLSGMGYEVSATETSAGDGLTVSDVTIAMDMNDETGTARISLGELRFVEKGDGTVAVELPATMPIVMNLTPKEGDPVSVALDYTQSGFAMIASGQPTDMVYDYSADRLGMTLTEVVVDGTAISEDDVSGSVTLADLQGQTQMTIGALRSYAQTLTASKISYDAYFNDPEGGGSAKITGASDMLAFEGAGEVPLGVAQSTDMSEMLASGLTVDGTFTNGAGSSDMAVTGPDGPVTGSTASQGGSLAVAMSQNGIAYNVAQNGLAVNLVSAAAPLPIAFEVDEARFNLSAPVRKSDEAQDFALGFTLGDFTMSDMIWGIFDPAAQLPRDPATIALELTGKAKVLMDFLDPTVAARMETSGEAPGELETLSIDKLQVTVAGAELTGEGDFAFDNSAEFNGMPKPTGAANFTLVGGNALIDTLVNMGLLPQEQAMGARMMMGLFAVPGDAPDTLNSKIEINEEGHVLANGQRIQ